MVSVTVVPKKVDVDNVTIDKNTNGEIQVKESGLSLVPIGCILPWHKSLTGTPTLPPQFVECNGQVLNDAESPYNGQTIPDLNVTQRFLRGSSTSGTTGGTETHNHTATLNLNEGSAVGTQWNNTSSVLTTTNKNHLPPYMEIVHIMRIK